MSELGETFELSTPALIDSVEFMLFKTGEPTVNLTAVIYLFDEDTKAPSEQLARSQPVNSSLLPDRWPGQIFKFEFEHGPLLTPEKTYAVALQTECSGIEYGRGRPWVRMGDGDNYEGLPFLFYDGSYHFIISDFVFILYGRVPGAVTVRQ